MAVHRPSGTSVLSWKLNQELRHARLVGGGRDSSKSNVSNAAPIRVTLKFKMAGGHVPHPCVAHAPGKSSSLVGLLVTYTSSWLISAVLADNGSNEATASMGGNGAARNITTTQRLNGHSSSS